MPYCTDLQTTVSSTNKSSLLFALESWHGLKLRRFFCVQPENTPMNQRLATKAKSFAAYCVTLLQLRARVTEGRNSGGGGKPSSYQLGQTSEGSDTAHVYNWVCFNCIPVRAISENSKCTRENFVISSSATPKLQDTGNKQKVLPVHVQHVTSNRNEVYSKTEHNRKR